MNVEIKNKTTKELVTIIETLLEGLLIDGAHHKQDSISKALNLLMGKEQLESFIAFHNEFETYGEYVEEYGEFDFGIEP